MRNSGERNKIVVWAKNRAFLAFYGYNNYGKQWTPYTLAKKEATYSSQPEYTDELQSNEISANTPHFKAHLIIAPLQER